MDIGLKVLNYVRSLTTFLELFRYLIMKVVRVRVVLKRTVVGD